ncbi:hypothetical protein MUP77_05695, partial [Candidatus Bathyarchaeota archaeon]|nr:hypothetical protein [Candidatus Bathyarchaeota archaeon]
VYPIELNQKVITYRPNASDFESEMKLISETAEEAEQRRNGLVIFIGFDTFISRFGSDKLLKMVEAIVNYARQNGTTIVGTMKRGMEFTEYITHIADSHIVFKDLDNALVIYGMRPKTGLYAVDLIENQVRLVPII